MVRSVRLIPDAYFSGGMAGLSLTRGPWQSLGPDLGPCVQVLTCS